MEFLNIGAGELLVIVLLALILFGPEDIVKIMRTLGKYTRSARKMWNEFSATLEQEVGVEGELSEVIGETKNVMNTLKSSVNEISTSVSSNVAAAQRTIETEARESAAAAEETARSAAQALTDEVTEALPSISEPSLVDQAYAAVKAAQSAEESGTDGSMPVAAAAALATEAAVPAEDPTLGVDATAPEFEDVVPHEAPTLDSDAAAPQSEAAVPVEAPALESDTAAPASDAALRDDPTLDADASPPASESGEDPESAENGSDPLPLRLPSGPPDPELTAQLIASLLARKTPAAMTEDPQPAPEAEEPPVAALEP